MSIIRYENQALYIESVSLDAIAEEYGTPCYVYSKAAITQGFDAYQKALADYPHLIAFAVKANGNIHVLQTLKELGSGFDVVSIGELKRSLIAGVDTNKIVFSGVGKNEDEIASALECEIGCFNVESESELNLINKVAISMKRTASVAIRVNPDVDAKTHPYISTGLKHNKFGISGEEVERLYVKMREMPGLHAKGISFHIGSQIASVDPMLEAFDYTLKIVKRLHQQGISLEHIDIGGGLGVSYREDDLMPKPVDYISKIIEKLKATALPLRLIVEPGRSIIAHAGILLTTVTYIKKTSERDFLIVDAGMNDLARPALYGAYHNIMPTLKNHNNVERLCDVVGPVCESSDFLGLNRNLSVAEGGRLCISDVGAYGYAMASNYNARNKPCEVLVENDKAHLIKRRETFEDTVRLEQGL